MSWHEVTSVDELARRGAMVFKHEVEPGRRLQLAIIHTPERCYAIDNRCPHEGYPLSQGKVDGCVLTCNWHNWKFDLETGNNLWGGDHVRSYPVELRAGSVWVDLTQPPIEVVIERILAGLREAFDEQDHGWIARQLARLVAAGVDPVTTAIPTAIAWCAPRLEWGHRHAFAATADWLALHDRLDPEQLEPRLVCLTEAVEHLAHDALRQPEFPFPEPASAPFDHDRLLAAIEAEDADQAIAAVRGAVAAGLGFAQLERSLSHAALSHYTGFGHALIYVVKTGELIDRVDRLGRLGRLGPAVVDPLLAALTRYIVHATREDLIPEFRSYAGALAAYPSAPGEAREPIADAEVEALRGASLREVFAWIHAHATTHAPELIWDALVQASADNMLCFDLRRAAASEVKVADSIGWLDFTHALTFGSAIRQQCGRFPELWPAGLLQLGCFVARNRAYLDPDIDLADWRIEDEPQFWSEVREQLLDHGLPLPIHAAHLLKTSTAIEREAPTLTPRTRELALAAVHRLLRSPLKQKHARRNVHQALALVLG